jgi:hypothetical protein
MVVTIYLISLLTQGGGFTITEAMKVYFFKEEGTPFVKIGIASNLNKRLVSAQVNNPRKIIVIRSFKGGRFEEAQAHERFARRRVRGEWFLFCRAMLTWRPKHHSLKKPQKLAPHATKAARIIELFGGLSALGRATGINHGQIGLWRTSAGPLHGYRRGLVPKRYHKRIKLAAKRLGIKLKNNDLS